MDNVNDVDNGVKNLKRFIGLATVSAEEYQKINIQLVKHLTKDKKIPGVYVTLNKPFNIIKGILEKGGVDTKEIIFIDGVTKATGSKVTKAKNCLFIGNPENLSDISVAMEQAVKSLPGKEKFLFFDSLSTLLLYNNVETVARFIHFLAGKMRVWNIEGVIISLEREKDKELIEELSQFCDIIGHRVNDILVKKTGWKLFVTPVHKKVLPIVIPSGVLGFVFYSMVQVFIEKMPISSFKTKVFLASIIFLYIWFVMLFFLLACLVYTFVDYHQKKGDKGIMKELQLRE